MRYSVIADVSVLQSYADLRNWAMPVIELLELVAEDEDTLVGVPALCLLDALDRLSLPEQLILADLIEDPRSAMEIMPLTGKNTWQVAARPMRQSAAVAHAVAAALEQNAWLATYEPAQYAGLIDDDGVIDLGQ